MNDVARIKTLAEREKYREWYLRHRDPIAEDRMLWRAQTFRHMVHLLPGQTILELGCGEGLFTRQLEFVSRGENPLTAVTFASGTRKPECMSNDIEFFAVNSMPGALAGRHYDFIVAMDLLDQSDCTSVLPNVLTLLNPGGQVVFYQSNPWNVVLKIRQFIARMLGRRDPRNLLNRPQLCELMSEVGFTRTFAVFNDFVYAPLTRRFIWFLRNLSIVLENVPLIRTLAGSILIHAQKPPQQAERPNTSLFAHEQLRGAVSVVIPCRNEAMNIEPLVRRLCGLYDDYIHEIIPVDDNSTDETAGIIRQMALEDSRVKPLYRNPPNGVGRALAEGYRAAKGRYVLSMDCDFLHLLPEVRDLFDAAAQGNEVIIGSRFSRHSVLLNYPFQKVLANRGFHLLARLVLLQHFRDLTNNLKLIPREIVRRLQIMEPGFAANAETGLQPLMMGCKIQEVPISWINRTPEMGISSFRLAFEGSGYVRVLFRLWLKRRLGYGAYKQIAINKKI